MSDCPTEAFDPGQLRRFDLAGPRYPLYPTANRFGSLTPARYMEAMERGNARNPIAPLSIYMQVPFCASPCFYCGCRRVMTTLERAFGFAGAGFREFAIEIDRRTVDAARMVRLHLMGFIVFRLAHRISTRGVRRRSTACRCRS